MSDDLPPGWLLAPMSQLLTRIEAGSSFKCDERPPRGNEYDILPEHLKAWVMWFLQSRPGRDQIQALSTGNQESMRNSGQERIGKIRVPVASSGEMKRSVSRIEELFSNIEEGERALERVQKLVERHRQSVLKAAVTGELTREWRERHKGPLESGEALLQRILKARREAWEMAELAKLEAKRQGAVGNGWQQRYQEPAGLGRQLSR